MEGEKRENMTKYIVPLLLPFNDDFHIDDSDEFRHWCEFSVRLHILVMLFLFCLPWDSHILTVFKIVSKRKVRPDAQEVENVSKLKKEVTESQGSNRGVTWT